MQCHVVLSIVHCRKRTVDGVRGGGASLLTMYMYSQKNMCLIMSVHSGMQSVQCVQVIRGLRHGGREVCFR